MISFKGFKTLIKKLSKNVKIIYPNKIKDAIEIYTSKANKHIVPTGLRPIGYLFFYQYSVPLGLSRRDNMLVESEIHVSKKSRRDDMYN